MFSNLSAYSIDVNQNAMRGLRTYILDDFVTIDEEGACPRM
jgi:hypothetical protein